MAYGTAIFNSLDKGSLFAWFLQKNEMFNNVTLDTKQC